MFGSIPAGGKKDVHVYAPKPRLMAQALVDVYEVMRPHISIMDAIIGMDGNGPNAGDPKQIGLMLASTDGVSLDAVASSIVGFNPMEVPIIKFAHERGIGTADLKEISVLGEAIENVLVPDFRRPSSSSQDFASKYVPNFLLSGMFHHSCTVVSTIKHSNCTKCYECIVNCPAKAMSASASGGQVIVDEDKCIGCFCCDEVCNFKAIKMKRSFIGETLLAMAKYLGVERVD
jgi:ferredoxin